MAGHVHLISIKVSIQLQHSLRKAGLWIQLFIVCVIVVAGDAAKLACAELPTVIRIGIAGVGIGNRPYSGGSTVSIVHACGLLEKEFSSTGIKIDWIFYKGAGPAVNEAIAGGQLDFALQGDLPAIVGRAGGLQTRLLVASGGFANTYLAAPVGSPVHSLADLKARTVANFKGTNLELAAARILATVHLTESDLNLLNLENAGIKAALASKQIDAGFGQLDLLMLRDRGLVTIPYSTKDHSLKLTRQAHLLVTNDFDERYPAIVDRVVKVLVGAAYWASQEQHRNEVFAIWSKAGIPAQYFAEDYKGDSMKLRNSPLFDQFMTTRYQAAAAEAISFDLVRDKVDVANWIDRGPLDAALANLGLRNYWPQLDQDGHIKEG
jgi:sulfonate transport system substrate-binding protein